MTELLRIPDPEMTNLLSAFGNHEGKALLLSFMETDIPRRAPELRGVMREIQGINPVWIPSSKLAFEYCERSLAPIGLVAYEFIDGFNNWGYARSRYGEEVGKPLAGLLLDYSRRHERISLYQMLGNTHTFNARSEDIPIPRAQETRLKIYWELLTGALPVRLADLEDRLGLDNKLIMGHLNQMQRFGLVEYESTPSEEPITYYKMAPKPPAENPTPFKGYKSYTDKAYELLTQDPDRLWTCGDMATETTKDRQTRTKLDSSEYFYQLTKTFSSIFSHLRKNNYVEVSNFDNKRRSKVDLTPDQKEILNEFVELIDAFQNQDRAVIARGHSLATSLTELDIKVLLEKARENSPNARTHSVERTEDYIYSIIVQNPGISATQMKQELSKLGRPLTEFRIRSVLLKLESEGLTNGDRSKKTICWYPGEPRIQNANQSN